MLLLSMLRAGFSRRSVAVATAAGIAASALLRLWMWERGTNLDRLFFGFDTRCDTLLVGCLAGIYVTFPDRHTPFARRATQLAGAAGVAALALMLVVTSHDDPFLFRGGFTLIAAAAAGLVLSVVDHPDGVLARVLAWRPLVHLGDISYGLYLWHWPVFLSLVPSDLGMSPLATNVARFAATLALAEMSAALVERPFLRLKSRWR
jgi:peptidoglycan/LPS O-acetylase OafA/YrhL